MRKPLVFEDSNLTVLKMLNTKSCGQPLLVLKSFLNKKIFVRYDRCTLGGMS